MVNLQKNLQIFFCGSSDFFRLNRVPISDLEEKHLEARIIELDDGKIYRKALYLMVKTHGFPVDFPLNQSIDRSCH